MKIKLLLPALLLSISAFAQSPLNGFYGDNNGSNTGSDTYNVITTSSNVDEAVSGSNVIWNFNPSTSVGMSSTQINVPTTGQIALFPGTTSIVHTNVNIGNNNDASDIYLSNTSSGSYITGIDASGVVLNYSTNNAYIGTFPLNYGYSNTDDIAGIFTTNDIEGTFTGTFQASVDAYGTLSTSEGTEFPVTRLKITQNITLYYLGFAAGTLNQTMYNYYEGSMPASTPFFRSLVSSVNVPAMDLDYTTTLREAYLASLATDDIVGVNKTINVVPNPVANLLHFAGNQAITAVTITDVTGKVVLESNLTNDIDISSLNSGVYFVSAQTDKGVAVTKIVKQ